LTESNKPYHKILEELNGDDTLAFRQVYLNYWERLYIYAYNILENQKICEDLIQEIFLSFWKNRHKVEIENLKAYLYQSLRFQIFKHFRDQKTTLLNIEKFEQILKTNSIEESLDLDDLEASIHKHINELPRRCRDIFYLSRFENLSHKEIAEKFDISTRTVKNQITTALKHLRSQIKDASFFWILSLLFNL